MDVRHLEQILEICRSGGFSGAARRLNISQPTLSKSIARLEARLSLQLFERQGGAARPTAYGAFVAQRAEALLQDVAALSRDLEQLARGDEGRLRIAVGPATRLRPLPQLLRLTAGRLPKLRIETLLVPSAGVAQALHDGQADLGFGHSEHATAYPDLIRKKLFEDRVVFAARPGHPVLALREAGPRDILAHPVALSDVPPGLERWAGALTRNEADNLKAFVSEDYGLILERAACSDTVAVGARFLFRQALEDGRLVEVPTGLSLTYVCWMLTTAERWRSPILKVMAEIARSAATVRRDGETARAE